MMNDQFEQWIRKSAPVTPINAMKKEAHRAILKERLRARELKHGRRCQRSRHTGALTILLMFLLIGGNASHLGSDGFDVVLKELELPGISRLAINEFRNSKCNVEKEDSSQDIENFYQQLEARDGTPVGLVVYEIQGAAHWQIDREYRVGDENRVIAQRVRDKPGEVTRAMMDFFGTELNLLTRQIEAGTLLPVATGDEVVDGYRFRIRSYEYQSKKFGTVTYMKGELIR